MNQCYQISEHLKQYGSITAIEALNNYGCFRLAARVNDLRKTGLDVKNEIVKERNKRFARYYLSNKKPVKHR